MLVKEASDIPKLLNAHLIVALPVLLMIVVYFPSQPPSPPSAVVDERNNKAPGSSSPVVARNLAQSYNPYGTHIGLAPDGADATTGGIGGDIQSETDPDAGASFTVLCKEFCAESARLTKIKSFMLLAWAGGALQGMYNSWSGSLDSIVPQDKFSVAYCGWVGFASTLAQIFTACLVGFVVDRVPSLQRRMKSLLLALLLVTGGIMAWITLALPLGISATTGEQPAPVLEESTGVTAVAIVAYGAVLGCTSPLFFEFAVELTYPAPESLSAGIMQAYWGRG